MPRVFKTATSISAMLTALLLHLPAAASQPPLSVEETTNIAEEAMIYGFPIVLNYKFFHDTFLDSSKPSYKGALNQLHSDARVYTSKDRAVQTPNSDTPYGLLGADLRAEPLVFCNSAIEKGRYYSVQMVDMYTFNYGYIGTRTTGNKAACYMVTGPGWQGETPKKIAKTFHSETPFSMLIFRTQLFGESDIANVKKIQAGYTVQTLSAYLNQPAPPAAPVIDWLAAPAEILKTGFPVALDYLLSNFLPAEGKAAGEKPLRDRLASIGIGTDKTLSVQQLDAEHKAALGKGMKQAFGKIGQTVDNLGTNFSGWRIGVAAGSREFYNNNWLLRSAGARAGIYGNDAEEATYPFTKWDHNGLPLDGSRHNYTMTFSKDQLPPVNAFWSLTMYDASSQFLVENPIHRYLINAPMLDQLKRNADGSITIFIQQKSPGKEKEANWLPAPKGKIFMVMRLYSPKEGKVSVLPAGKGNWAPPPVIPVANLNAARNKRPGDKTYESVVRTDERYGGDPFLHGPRGWPYWNFLEYPKPIQNPNLWPDTQSTYFLSKMKLPASSTLTFSGEFPHARYFKYALYRWQDNTFVGFGEDLPGKEIIPESGSINPYAVGNERLGDQRNYQVHIVAEDAPANKKKRAANTMYVGKAGGEFQMVVRIYLPDQGMDGAGWGPNDTPSHARGLPTYTGTLADGAHLDAAGVIEHFALPMTAATKKPVNDQQWAGLVNSPDNDPALGLGSTPAHKNPKWEKYWNFKYSIIGAFKSPADRAKIPSTVTNDGGGDPATQYLYSYISRKFGPVYVMRGKMPTFPDTYSGVGGQGLDVMPKAQTQYWSLVSGESPASGHIVDGLTDMQVPLDKNRNYTIVVSRKEDRPANAALENGVAWMEWSPRGEGLHSPQNRKDFGILMLRMMSNDPSWKQRPDRISKPGMEEKIMGDYLPKGEYTTKAAFEALKLNK